MPHELVIFPNGTASVRPQGHKEDGEPNICREPMHSSIGAWEEANAIYIEQSGLKERLDSLTAKDPKPLVVYDVGMGIAANALAAIRCATRDSRPLHIVSFENAPDGLELALRNAERFPFFGGYESALGQLLETGNWESDSSARIRWELRTGDYLAQPLGRPEPEVIYYDFYSPRQENAALWGHQAFRRLWDSCAGRRALGKPVTLTTYSSATRVRSAMLLAGFAVGRGAATSLKSETTVASTSARDLASPLGEEWLGQLERSAKPLPEDWPRERGPEAFAETRERIVRQILDSRNSCIAPQS
jgi:queuine tRNA-ribosyltransferase